MGRSDNDALAEIIKTMDLLSKADDLPEVRWTMRDPGRTKQAYVCKSPRGETVTVQKSVGDARSLKNVEARLRRAKFYDDAENYEKFRREQARQRTQQGREAADRKAEKLAAAALAAGPPAPPADISVPAVVSTPAAVPATPPVTLQTLVGAAIGAPSPLPAAPPAASNGHRTAPPTPAAAGDDELELWTPIGEGIPQDGELHARVETLTYPRALELRDRPMALLSNGKPLIQRDISPKKIDWLAGIMRRHLTDEPGAWSTHHQGFAVGPLQPDENGNLVARREVDGQHRLLAFIRVCENGGTVDLDDGTTVFVPAQPDARLKVMFTYNVNPDDFWDMDKGLPRSAANTMTALGHGVDAKVLSRAGKLFYAVRGHYAAPYDEEAGVRTGLFGNAQYLDRVTPTDRQLGDILKDDSLLQPHVYAGVTAAKGVSIKRGPQGSAAAFIVFRAIAYAAYPQMLDQLNEFCKAVGTGENISKGNPAYTVREYIQNGSGTSAGSTVLKQYAALVYTWNAYIKGVSYDKMQVNLKRPLPHPTVAPRRAAKTAVQSAAVQP